MQLGVESIPRMGGTTGDRPPAIGHASRCSMRARKWLDDQAATCLGSACCEDLAAQEAGGDELYGKRLTLLRELLPRAASVAVLCASDAVLHRNELSAGLALRIEPVEL